MSDVLLISGSPALNSRSSHLLAFAASTLDAWNVSNDTVSILDFPAEDLIQARYESESFTAFKAKVETARAIIIATPIYKGSFTGGLKALLDILPQNSLRGKTIVPIATAGTQAHLLAIDYSLKPVLSVLGATDLRQGVFVVDTQFHYTDTGFRLDDHVQERFDTSLGRLAVTLKAQVQV